MSENKVKSEEGWEGKSFIIASDKDIVNIRDFARKLAEDIGFSNNDRTLIATAVSEICRNVIEYARKGEVNIQFVHKNPKTGIRIEIQDKGPGISDIEQAMQDGFSTKRGMGVGLPGTKRIMDDFEIQSARGKGTTVIMYKWHA